jgi:glutaredoxin
MKKNILKLLLLISTSIYANESIPWHSYNEGMLKKEEKAKLYMLSATYCTYCEKDKKLMDNDKHLNKYINNNFIAISQEKDIEKVPTYLDNSLTPIYYVLNDKGEILGEPLRGSQNKETLLKFLNVSHYKYKYESKK